MDFNHRNEPENFREHRRDLALPKAYHVRTCAKEKRPKDFSDGLSRISAARDRLSLT